MSDPRITRRSDLFFVHEEPEDKIRQGDKKRNTDGTYIRSLYKSTVVACATDHSDWGTSPSALDSESFPAPPGLHVMQTANSLLNHMPISKTEFANESEYHEQLLKWFMTLPQQGLLSVVQSLRNWVIPALHSRPEVQTQYPDIDIFEIKKMSRYLSSLAAQIDTARATAIYTISWKKGGITAHPLLAFATTTIFQDTHHKAHHGVLLLRELLCPLLLAKNHFWQVNRRETSVLANATRLARDLVDVSFYPEEIMRLHQSVNDEGGWESIASENWVQWLFKLKNDKSVRRVFQPAKDGSNFCRVYSYLESVLRVLSASSIHRRRRTEKFPTGFEKECLLTSPVINHLTDLVDLTDSNGLEDIGWSQLLPLFDEILDDDEVNDDTETFLRDGSGVMNVPGIDSDDYSKSYTAIRIKTKQRARTIQELQFQTIGAIEKLQHCERGNRVHLRNFNVASDYEIQMIWNEIFKSPSPNTLNIASGLLNNIGWLLIFNLCLSMNEAQLRSIQFVRSKDIAFFKAQLSNKSGDATAKPALLELTGRSDDRAMRLHLPVFRPDHKAKDKPISWLTLSITPPRGLDTLQIKSKDQGFGDAIAVMKKIFEDLNCRMLLELRFATLSKRMRTLIGASESSGETAGRYLLGKLGTGGDSAVIYSRYEIKQLDDLMKSALNGLFEQTNAMDRNGLAIDLIWGYDDNSVASAYVGSSRVPHMDQVRNLVLFTRENLLSTAGSSGAIVSTSRDVMQAWQDYLLTWFLLITGERANDNALATAYFIDELTGTVFSGSKTDERFSNSTLFTVTNAWLQEFKRYQIQSRLIRILYTRELSDLSLHLVDGTRPSANRDRLEFQHKLFKVAPVFIDWPRLLETGEVSQCGVSNRMRELWVQSNPSPGALGFWQGNELRHFFATNARQAGINSDRVAGWMAHWINGQSPHRVTSTFVLSKSDSFEIQQYQHELERRFGYLSPMCKSIEPDLIVDITSKS